VWGIPPQRKIEISLLSLSCCVWISDYHLPNWSVCLCIDCVHLGIRHVSQKRKSRVRPARFSLILMTDDLLLPVNHHEPPRMVRICKFRMSSRQFSQRDKSFSCKMMMWGVQLGNLHPVH
jgi:hypothetical protein